MNQFAAAFGGIQEARKEQSQTPLTPMPPPPAKKRKAPPTNPVDVQAPSALAKSRNPAYEPVKLFMHAEKRRQAERKWEDEGGRDLSGLIESLLTKYLGT